MKNQKIFTGFNITKCGEINSDKLNDFKLSLNEFYFEKNDSNYNSFLVRGFEIKDQSLVDNWLLLEYEETLKKLISNS